MSKIKFVFLLILGFIIYKGFVAIKNFEIGVNKEVAQIEKMGFEKVGSKDFADHSVAYFLK